MFNCSNQVNHLSEEGGNWRHNGKFTIVTSCGHIRAFQGRLENDRIHGLIETLKSSCTITREAKSVTTAVIQTSKLKLSLDGKYSVLFSLPNILICIIQSSSCMYKWMYNKQAMKKLVIAVMRAFKMPEARVRYPPTKLRARLAAIRSEYKVEK